MPRRYIVVGQRINPVKLERAKSMRRNMTPAETRLWSALRRNQLDGLHFRRQQIIDGFIVDFYCHAAGLVVEVDGPVHETQREYDAKRDRVLSARQLRVLRVRNEEVMGDLSGVLERIRDACHDSIPRLFSSGEREPDAPGRLEKRSSEEVL